MERVCLVEEISDQFWGSNKTTVKHNESWKMNRSESEWAYQRFLVEASTRRRSSPSSSAGDREDVVHIAVSTGNHTRKLSRVTNSDSSSFVNGRPDIPTDTEEYQAFLKNKLHLACAAVAYRGSFLKAQDSSTVTDCESQAPNTSKMESPTPSKGGENDLKEKSINGSIGVSSFPSTKIKSLLRAMPIISGSSEEQSNDDEVGEIEIFQNTDPANAKRVRRMLSNRESASRSRRRKQAHLRDLETQAARLRVENSTLSKRIANINKKYNDAAVDNRALKAAAESLRAKVKIAEETVKRITGLNPIMPDMFDQSSFDESSNTSLLARDNPMLESSLIKIVQHRISQEASSAGKIR